MYVTDRIGCPIRLVSPFRSEELTWLLLRKEVIQPLVPQRLPCYDFIPVTEHTLVPYLPCGLDHRLLLQRAFVV